MLEATPVILPARGDRPACGARVATVHVVTAVRTGSWTGAARQVAGRPSLWGTALVQGARLVPRGWWRRPPFLPRPDPAYLRFRLRAQYGDDARLDPDDLVTYLEWCRAMSRETARGRRAR